MDVLVQDAKMQVYNGDVKQRGWGAMEINYEGGQGHQDGGWHRNSE